MTPDQHHLTRATELLDQADALLDQADADAVEAARQAEDVARFVRGLCLGAAVALFLWVLMGLAIGVAQ